jgi:glycosyltransferase involved in cell wall biosynthesis
MASDSLRIGVDARGAAEVGAGRGRYVRELVRALLALEGDHELVLYGRSAWRLAGTRWRLLATPDPAWAAHAGALAARDCDVLLASNSFLMCATSTVPAVAVVQDLFGFDRRFAAPLGAFAERATLPLAARRAAGFLCPSEATRADLVRRFPALADRSRVVPLGVDPGFGARVPAGVPAGYGLEGPYVLAVGTLEPRKNLPRLIEAFASLPDSVRRRHRLALAGSPGWSLGETEALIDAHEEVTALGYVADEDLPALYAEARVFAYPSLAEGFGLPVLEAMAAGTAVLTSDRSSLPEVAGDAARLVDPGDVGSIRGGLLELLTDEDRREQLARRGRSRAAAFTWQRTASETVAYLTSVTSTFAAGNRRARNVSS